MEEVVEQKTVQETVEEKAGEINEPEIAEQEISEITNEA